MLVLRVWQAILDIFTGFWFLFAPSGFSLSGPQSLGTVLTGMEKRRVEGEGGTRQVGRTQSLSLWEPVRGVISSEQSVGTVV